MNSSQVKLVKKLSDNGFKHLTREFGSENLKLLKQKDAYPNEYMDGFKRFFDNNYLIKIFLYRSLKDGATTDKGEKLDVT